MGLVTFDGDNHLIIVASGIEELDAQIDLYSDWKEWMQSGDNVKYYPAFDTPDGGRDLSPILKNGDYYFLNNQDFPELYPGTGIRDGWRLRPYEGDHELVINGNLYVADITKPWVVPTLGDYTVVVRLETSSLTQTVVSGSGVTEQDKTDIIEGVWAEPGRALANPDDYKADVSGLATSSALSTHDTDIKNAISGMDFTSLENLIKQLREKNISYTFVKATEQIPGRNVGVDCVNYMIIKVKQDTDSDWDSPVSTGNLYFWYENMNDTNPIYIGEET